MTSPDHHEPLDAEERDLAARLGRVGPIDGPPPALDAKILSAAHAAASARKPSRRHRLVWLGIPPALITGVGVAATVVLALGLVWQLRPPSSGIIVRGEADAGEEIIVIAQQPSATRAPAAPPPPVPAADAPAESARAKGAKAAGTAREAPRPAAESATAAPAPAMVADETAPLARAAANADVPREADPAARDAATESGFVAEPPAAQAAAPRKSHTYTTAARASAERRERAARDEAQTAAAASAAAAQSEEATLDRIEVTGSRIRSGDVVDWSGVAVGDDRRLDRIGWLERVRARRDSGDLDGARASLRLFQREHPRVHLPDDLRELLAEAPR